MTDKHMKRCSTSLVIKKRQIKVTMTYNFTPTRIAVIKETKQWIISVGKDVKQLWYILGPCWWEKSRSSWESYREQPFNPVIPLPSIHPREINSYVNTKTYTEVHSRTICNSRQVETAHTCISWWMDKHSGVTPLQRTITQPYEGVQF